MRSSSALSGGQRRTLSDSSSFPVVAAVGEERGVESSLLRLAMWSSPGEVHFRLRELIRKRNRSVAAPTRLFGSGSLTKSTNERAEKLYVRYFVFARMNSLLVQQLPVYSECTCLPILLCRAKSSADGPFSGKGAGRVILLGPMSLPRKG